MTLREALVRKQIPWRASANNHLSMCCLFCPDYGESRDTRFRLSINLYNGAAICFNCGFKTRYGFAAILRKLSLPAEIEGEVAEKVQTELPRLPDDFQLLHHTYSDLDEIALKYLQDRRISRRQISEKGIGVSLSGRFAYRIVFPVRYQRRLLGLVCRDFTGNQQPKYLNSKGEKGLYNFAPGKRAILSEGVFKALRIERLNTGFQSMALLGKSITDFQVKQLHEGGYKEVVLWPDPDKPGRDGVRTVAERLQQERFCTGVVWPVSRPADDEPLSGLQSTWANIQGYSWLLQQRIAVA